MKSILILILFILATTAAFWFVWMNRASEKIVSSTVPIAIAAVVSVFLAGWVFGGEPDSESEFPVCFMLDLESGLPLDSVEEMNKFAQANTDIFSVRRLNFWPTPILGLK